MRSASRPRITGRLALGPKPVEETPGRPSRVWPSVLPWRSVKASPCSALAGATISLSSLPSGLAVTTTVFRVLRSALSAASALSAGAPRIGAARGEQGGERGDGAQGGA